MTAKTSTRAEDAAKLARLCQRADDSYKVWAEKMQEAMPLWQTYCRNRDMRNAFTKRMRGRLYIKKKAK